MSPASLLLLLAAAPAQLPATPPERPNVLFLFADDQRADTIGALGNPAIDTPNLDRIAAAGTALTRVYCMGSYSGAVCAPSRAMLNSGRSLFHFLEQPFNPPDQDSTLLAEHFRAAGYQTFATGKWHNGKAWFQRGFEDGGAIFFGGMGPHLGLRCFPYDPTGAYPKESQYAEPRFSSTAFVEETLAFLERRDPNRPFFAYVAFTAPHDPRTPPDAHLARYQGAGLPPLPPNFLPRHPFDNGELVIRDEKLAPWPRGPQLVREHLAAYYGMITQMDEQIGRLLDALEARGLRDQTLIVYASDHGLGVGSHGLLGKQNLYEHSMRTTALLAGPGVPAGVRQESLAYLFDLSPTLCALAGLPVPSSMEGLSLRPVLRAAPAAPDAVRAGVLTAYRKFQRAWTTPRWKLLWYPELARWQIFDLEADPHETNDLIGTDAGRAAKDRLVPDLHAAMLAAGDPLADALAAQITN